MMERAYTLGNSFSYDKAMRQPGGCTKLGRRPAGDERFPEGYGGGCLFRTVDEAIRFREEYEVYSGFRVYEVALPNSWEEDAEFSSQQGHHELLRDAKVLRVMDERCGGPQRMATFNPEFPTCPYCCCRDAVTTLSTQHTCLGFFSDDPQDDPNLYTTRCFCRMCGREFTIQWVPADRRGVAVIDNRGAVRFGEPPGDSDRYLLPCSCGGWFQHSRRGKSLELDAGPDGSWKPLHPMFWRCADCGEVRRDRRYPDALTIRSSKEP